MGFENDLCCFFKWSLAAIGRSEAALLRVLTPFARYFLGWSRIAISRYGLAVKVNNLGPVEKAWFL